MDMPPTNIGSCSQLISENPWSRPGWLDHYDTLYVVMSTSFLSLIFSLPVLVIYYRVPSLRQSPNNLVMARTVCDLGINITWLASFFVQYSSHHPQTLTCSFCTDTIQGNLAAAWFQMFLFCSEGFYCCISLHLFSGNHPFSNSVTLNRKYFGCSVALAIILAIVLVADDPGTYLLLHYSSNPEDVYRAIGICWLDNNPREVTDYRSWALLYAWIVVAYAFGTSYAFIAHRRWSRATGKINTQPHRLNALRRNRVSVLVFTIYSVIQVCMVIPALFEPTRLLSISYAVFCLKKKKKQIDI
eukprot:TRINITY_DN50472_c0_g2_i1.p1 TRINITY_DN50472_c0_g2~~TRINITY_DN50472_c0_g2_i1.p1  ORF type:complete len:300 (+),score=65.20 TRINITY_DN50472_c0_g2_i1:158-1057(+)